MTRWEYLEVDALNDDLDCTPLDELGAEGWELVTVLAFRGGFFFRKPLAYAIFKRPVPSED